MKTARAREFVAETSSNEPHSKRARLSSESAEQVSIPRCRGAGKKSMGERGRKSKGGTNGSADGRSEARRGARQSWRVTCGPEGPGVRASGPWMAPLRATGLISRGEGKGARGWGALCRARRAALNNDAGGDKTKCKRPPSAPNQTTPQRLFRHSAAIKRPGRPEPISLANFRFEGKVSPPLRSDDKVRKKPRRRCLGAAGGAPRRRLRAKRAAPSPPLGLACYSCSRRPSSLSCACSRLGALHAHIHPLPQNNNRRVTTCTSLGRISAADVSFFLPPFRFHGSFFVVASPFRAKNRLKTFFFRPPNLSHETQAQTRSSPSLARARSGACSSAGTASSATTWPSR